MKRTGDADGAPGYCVYSLDILLIAFPVPDLHIHRKGALGPAAIPPL